MGTQSSYGGPGDRTPLLPAWALPTDSFDPVSLAPAPPEMPEPSPIAPEPAQTPAEPQAPPDPVAPSAPTPRAWQNARRSFSRAVSSGTPARYRSAARDYVRASGGSGRAARSARSGKAATVALGGFLSTAAGRGLDAALGRVGIVWAVGRDVSEVLAAISNALSPDGASKEEAAAREAINETLEHLYGRFLADGRDLTALEAMTPEDIAAAIERCVGTYVYNRWLGDLGLKIEEKAISPADAVRLERGMKGFVRETVRFDLSRIDVMALEWQGEAGRELVDSIYRDAYSLFGGER